MGVGADLHVAAVLTLVHALVDAPRTIGYSISPALSPKSSIGPTLTIWCTTGVSGTVAPAMRAMRGLQTPQQITAAPHSTRPDVVSTPLTRPLRLRKPVTSVFARISRAPMAMASSRIKVPARNESTTPVRGK